MDEHVDLHKAIHLSVWELFWLASWCKQESPSAAIPPGTSTKRADFLKEQIMVGLRSFKEAVPAVSS